ncbi:hypothetical protein DNTS_032556, partial [Danionella cerebrum]
APADLASCTLSSTAFVFALFITRQNKASPSVVLHCSTAYIFPLVSSATTDTVPPTFPPAADLKPVYYCKACSKLLFHETDAPPKKLVAYQREFHTLRERLRAAEHRTLQRSSELNAILEQFRRAIAETNGSKDALANFSGSPCRFQISTTTCLICSTMRAVCIQLCRWARGAAEGSSQGYLSFRAETPYEDSHVQPPA